MNELLSKLATEPAFENLKQWRVVPLRGGGAIRLSYEDQDVVAKLASPNEVETHRKLLPLNLKHVAVSRSPRLLDEGVLVTDFVPGGPIREPLLSQGLVIEMARIQNRLAPDYEPTPEDRATWKDHLLDAVDTGRLKLAQARQTGTVIELANLVRSLHSAWPDIAFDYAHMPFAWLHYDLREANVLAGPPQTVIDWGSSYGPGPFFHDMARFCIADDTTYRTFCSVSDICRRAKNDQLARWLYVAACANLAMMTKYLEVFEGELGHYMVEYRALERSNNG